MRTHDAWGNLCWSAPQPGQLFNRREAAWYLDYHRLMASTKRALALYIAGDKETALELIKVILELDPEERALAQKGWPNSYARLRDEIKHDRMFATKEELSHFKGKMKTQLMVADYYYEIEQWGEAYRRYRRFDREHGAELDTGARAYLDMMLGMAAWDEGRREEAQRLFESFLNERKYARTASWPRVLNLLATFYQGRPETREKTIDVRMKLIKHYGDSREGWKQKLALGTYHYVWKHPGEARAVFTDILDKCKDENICYCAKEWLAKMDKERDMIEQ